MLRASDNRAAGAVVATRRRLGREDGFSLIEVLVTLTLAIMMSVFVSAAESVFKTQAQQVQWTQQASADQLLADYVTKRLHDAPSRLGLARETDASKTDALTVAGDQLVIADATATTCFRVWHSATTKEVRATRGACSSVRPQRGPSETTPADGVLDNPASSFLLASNVQLTDGTAPPAPLFRYLDANGVQIALDDVAHDKTGNAGWYQQRSNADHIDSVRLTGFVASASTYATAKPRPFDRTLVLAP
jgi:Tfp pilus assembly protein PilV